MSSTGQLTDFGENKCADFFRAQGLTLPAAWRLAPLSAASDASVTEVTGTGIARFAMTRNLTNWSGTQGPGTTLASSGSSHQVSNNVLIDMGTASSGVGTVTHVGLFDASSGGNCWAAFELATPIVTASGVAVQVAIGELVVQLGATGGMTDYLVNKFLDKLLRGQTYDYPSSIWQAAYTAAPSNAGGGTEVGGGVGYARLELVPGLDTLSGTQAPASTSASSGSGGRISTNALRTFATPTGPWGDVGWGGFLDASTAGNLLWWAAMSVKSVRPGFPLAFAANAIGFTLD